ncbi:MAG: type II secretion system minor pseudopilin GspH [Thiohalomonadaceae bacterium]
MQTSATGMSSEKPHRRSASKGFTLLELLVVLLILGILFSLATLSIGNDQETQIKEDAYRLASLIELVSEEAILQGRQLGLKFTTEGYSFLFLAPQNEGPSLWLQLEQDKLLRPREFHPSTSAQLTLDDLPHALPATSAEHDAPQLYFLSSGERTPFMLRLSSNDQRIVYQLKSNALGPVKVGKELELP